MGDTAPAYESRMLTKIASKPHSNQVKPGHQYKSEFFDDFDVFDELVTNEVSANIIMTVMHEWDGNVGWDQLTMPTYDFQ